MHQDYLNEVIAKASGNVRDFAGDLNAMASVEPMLGKGYKRMQYIDRLCVICRRDGMEVHYLEAPFATAKQKAEAFVDVLELGATPQDAADTMPPRIGWEL